MQELGDRSYLRALVIEEPERQQRSSVSSTRPTLATASAATSRTVVPCSGIRTSAGRRDRRHAMTADPRHHTQ